MTGGPASTPPEEEGRGSLLVAAGIALSRVAGLVREVVIAAFLGSGPAVGAFTAAVKIPNLLQNLLGEGVLSASFIPSYSRLLAEGRHEEAGRVAATVLTLLMAATGALVVVGVVAAEPLTSLIAPGLVGEERALTVALVPIVTPGIGLLVASAWCLGVLNSHRRFFLSYVAPVVWNLAQVVAVAVAGWLVFDGAAEGDGVLLSPDARGLALVLGWATVVGAALQLAVQVPQVRALQPGIRPSFRIDTETRTVLRRFVPVVGARGVVQLSAYLDVVLASFLVAGGIASLRYGSVLYLLPISVFGMSIAASELPALSATGLGADRAQAAAAIRRRLRTGLQRIAWFVVPTAVAYVVAGDQVVGALLQRGRFDRSDTIQVWAVVAAFGLGLVASTASRLLQSALYGLGDTRTPARASTLRVLASVAVGVVLMLQLDRVGVTAAGGLSVDGGLPALAPVDEAARLAGDTLPRLGSAGLALGTAVAAWVEVRILRRRLQRVVGPIDLTGGALPETAAGAAAAAAVALLGRLALDGLPPLLAGLVVLPLAAVAYLATTRAVGFPLVAVRAGRPPRRLDPARRTRRPARPRQR